MFQGFDAQILASSWQVWLQFCQDDSHGILICSLASGHFTLQWILTPNGEIWDNHGTKWADFPWWNYWRVHFFLLSCRHAGWFCWSGRRIRMSTLKKENHNIDVIDYHIIYIYYIYTYFTSSQFFQLSKHRMLWTTKSFRRHFWGSVLWLLQVANTGGLVWGVVIKC